MISIALGLAVFAAVLVVLRYRRDALPKSEREALARQERLLREYVARSIVVLTLGTVGVAALGVRELTKLTLTALTEITTTEANMANGTNIGPPPKTPATSPLSAEFRAQLLEQRAGHLRVIADARRRIAAARSRPTRAAGARREKYTTAEGNIYGKPTRAAVNTVVSELLGQIEWERMMIDDIDAQLSWDGS